MADGVHTFQVQATDAAGNTDPTPASRTWTVDAATPTVAAVAPAEGATSVATTANVEATFSEAMNPETLTTSTFTLTKQGTTTPIAAVVTYEGTTKKATLDPTADLEANATYAATVKVGPDGAKDAWGNPLAVDRIWSFTTGSAPPADTTPPETSITSGPSGTVNSGTASFAFSSSEANSTYECSLDGTPFSGCTSPKEYNNLADGTHTFEVRATDAAGNTDATPASRTWTVQTVPTQNEQVLVGAGDIATSSTQNDEATAKLLDTIPGTVFTVGDHTYPDGTDAEFSSYYEPTWGRHKARTKPSVGDHEYRTPNASGYFNYFGASAGEPGKGYYSYDLGDWHVVVLNSNCTQIGGCEATSPMVMWLKGDLAANPRTCTVAYWHHPLFSSGYHGNISRVKPIWDAIYAANVDVVVNGNDHSYERFAPQDPNGVADTARGIREFVVGTGGAGLYSFGTIKPNSEIRNNSTHGVLKLTLKSGGYEWKFVPKASQVFTDSGSESCH